MMRMAFALACVLSIIGCKSGGNPGGDDDDDGIDAGIDAPPIEDGWTELIGRDWTISPNADDTYKCRRIQMTQSMWISGFRAIAPFGTHHTVVTISSGGQTGDYDCSVLNLDSQMLYASGVATDELLFPPDVAIQVSAGQYININLHLFNATDDPISGHSGILVKTSETEPVHKADMMFAGNMNFSIPWGDDRLVEGGCVSTEADYHVFTLWPHMHQFAKHQKVTATPKGRGQLTLHDDPYTFLEQRNYPMAELFLPKDSQIHVTCTYNNNTNPKVEIPFGDSSNEEMCFTGMYKYPAGGGLFQCSEL
ncbi:MAG: hypothetical protein WKG01_40040 [Kofleriaceae bacterium]